MSLLDNPKYQRSPTLWAVRLARRYMESPTLLDLLIGDLRFITSSKRDFGREQFHLKELLNDLERLRELIIADREAKKRNTGAP